MNYWRYYYSAFVLCSPEKLITLYRCSKKSGSTLILSASAEPSGNSGLRGICSVFQFLNLLKCHLIVKWTKTNERGLVWPIFATHLSNKVKYYYFRFKKNCVLATEGFDWVLKKMFGPPSTPCTPKKVDNSKLLHVPTYSSKLEQW